MDKLNEGSGSVNNDNVGDGGGGGVSGTGDSMECFTNYTAPEVFVQGLASIVNQPDVDTIIKSQKYMLARFEKTNEMLVNCNALSATRFQNALIDFKKHTTMLTEMRKDINNIFQRIRNVKAKLAHQYPQQYEIAAAAQRKEKIQEEQEDENEEVVGETEGQGQVQSQGSKKLSS